jgi:hypothetical protein
MSMLDRFEAGFERLVEGSVGRVFRSPVQPAEIGRRLERAMGAAEMISVGRRLAPNAYTVSMHPDDLAKFNEFLPALERQMAGWLASLAEERGRLTIDVIRVAIVPEAGLPRREIRVQASYAEWPERSAGQDAPLPPPAIPRRLHVLTGPQHGQELLLRGARVTIGRAPDNDVVLVDESVSRKHARIEIGRAGVRVTDLNSTNGTRLNGRPVQSALVEAGDDLEFGSVIVRVAP